MKRIFKKYKRHFLAAALTAFFFLPLFIVGIGEEIGYQQMRCEKIPEGPGLQDCAPDDFFMDSPAWENFSETIYSFYNNFEVAFLPLEILRTEIKETPVLHRAYVALPEWLALSFNLVSFLLYALLLFELLLWLATVVRSTLKTRL
jgi:hypothetical protein